MKICMLAPEFLPAWGGVGTYVVELVRHLPKNIDIHVVAPLREGFGKEKVATMNFDFPRYFGSNVHVHHICKARDTFFYNAAFQYACLKYVPRLLKEEHIDIIHSHTAHMPDLLLMLRKLDKPTVTTVHTTIKSQRLGTKFSKRNFIELERSEKITYVLYPFLRAAEKVYFRRDRFYVSPSNWMKRSLADSFHITKNVEVIPNSVDMTNYETREFESLGQDMIPQKFSNRNIILYVGRLLAMKGVDILINAIPEILKEIKSENLLFVFAGPGDQTRYLQKIKMMGLSDCCFFTGPLQNEIVVQLMKASKLVVLPSFIENMPYTILESMACGVPVVANDVGGISEIIEDGYNGKLVQSNSPKQIAMAILRLLRNESLRDFLGKHAQETISKKFSWSVNINKYCKVYNDALSQKHIGDK
jgi:glycosyltransferase involved in cell wall biosynthesis